MSNRNRHPAVGTRQIVDIIVNPLRSNGISSATLTLIAFRNIPSMTPGRSNGKIVKHRTPASS